jgi:2-methylcitrate dehydratase PrpD
MRLYFKPYPCCRWAHPAIEGLKQIMAREGITGGRIARIRIRGFAEAVKLCKMPPKTLEEAEYNVLYPVAVTALHGEFTPQHLREEHYGRPDVRAMMNVTEITADPAIQARFPEQCLSEVEVVTTEGKVCASGLMAAKGDFDNRLTEEELRAKFLMITRGILDEGQARGLLELMDHIEERKASDLISYLA